MTRQDKKRHRTFLAQRNEHRVTSMLYARVSCMQILLKGRSSCGHKLRPVSDSCSFSEKQLRLIGDQIDKNESSSV